MRSCSISLNVRKKLGARMGEVSNFNIFRQRLDGSEPTPSGNPRDPLTKIPTEVDAKYLTFCQCYPCNARVTPSFSSRVNLHVNLTKNLQ